LIDALPSSPLFLSFIGAGVEWLCTPFDYQASVLVWQSAHSEFAVSSFSSRSRGNAGRRSLFRRIADARSLFFWKYKVEALFFLSRRAQVIQILERISSPSAEGMIRMSLPKLIPANRFFPSFSFRSYRKADSRTPFPPSPPILAQQRRTCHQYSTHPDSGAGCGGVKSGGVPFPPRTVSLPRQPPPPTPLLSKRKTYKKSSSLLRRVFFELTHSKHQEFLYPFLACDG